MNKGIGTSIALTMLLCILKPDFSFSQNHQTHLRIGYFGNNIWNPGAQIQVNSIFKKRNHHFQLSFFTDPQSHSAILFNYGLSHSKNKLFFELSPLGVYRSILRQTYTISEDGSVSGPKRYSGNYYFSPGGAIGIHINKRLYTKFQFHILAPYNSRIMPLLNGSIGYRFHQNLKAS